MIAGAWRNVMRGDDVGETAHFVARGGTWAICGCGRPAPLARRRAVSLGTTAGILAHRCEKCRACIQAVLRKRKTTKERFERLMDKLERKEPAIAMQVTMAWPAHAQEDYSAEWWSDNAPAVINNMKEALRG